MFYIFIYTYIAAHCESLWNIKFWIGLLVKEWLLKLFSTPRYLVNHSFVYDPIILLFHSNQELNQGFLVCIQNWFSFNRKGKRNWIFSILFARIIWANFHLSVFSRMANKRNEETKCFYFLRFVRSSRYPLTGECIAIGIFPFKYFYTSSKFSNFLTAQSWGASPGN